MLKILHWKFKHHRLAGRHDDKAMGRMVTCRTDISVRGMFFEKKNRKFVEEKLSIYFYHRTSGARLAGFEDRNVMKTRGDTQMEVMAS